MRLTSNVRLPLQESLFSEIILENEIWEAQGEGGSELPVGFYWAFGPPYHHLLLVLGGKAQAYIWNPDEVYSRYIPRIYHVYSERRCIPGLYQVHTLDIEILFS